MTDIHTIKNLLMFLPYLKEETWYMLGAGIIIYVIYIIYLVAFERYYTSQKIVPEAPEKRSIRDALSTIQIDDIHFFEKLSLAIRTHLEDSHQVPLATKKTQQDIWKESISPDLKKVLDTCTYYEYTGQIASTQKKLETINQLKDAL